MAFQNEKWGLNSPKHEVQVFWGAGRESIKIHNVSFCLYAQYWSCCGKQSH